MGLSFLSLKDIYGTNHIHHLCSALSRKAGESIEYGHFVAHVFDGEEWCVYDGNKINYVQKKSVLEYEEFQKGIYAVSYIPIFAKLTISKLHLYLSVNGH